MRRLQVWSVRARRVVDRHRARRRERSSARRRTARRRDAERSAGSAHNDTVVLGHRSEDVLERPGARHPELVRVGVDHPVRAVIGGREACHATCATARRASHPRPGSGADDPRAHTPPGCRSSRRGTRDPSRSRSRRPRSGGSRSGRPTMSASSRTTSVWTSLIVDGGSSLDGLAQLLPRESVGVRFGPRVLS